MKPIVEIFSQGEEIVSGQVVDSNAAWLSQRLLTMGFAVKRHTAVGDNLEDLKALLNEISGRADCCICTGGLGPTIDDLTAQAVAEAFERPLQLDNDALSQIQGYFDRRDRPMVDANRKQAYLPKRSERIDNHWGTAPGFSLLEHRCRFFFLPGVPFEMKQLFDAGVKPELLKYFSLQPDCLVTLRSIGIGESDIQQKLVDIPLPDNVSLSFRTGSDEIQTKLLFPADCKQQHKTSLVKQFRERLGNYVFAVDGLDRKQGGLVDIINELMQQKNYRLALLETASQGLMAAKCVGREWLLSSEYRRISGDIVETPSSTWSTKGLEQRAIEYAERMRESQGVDLALVQLYQGDTNQFTDKDQRILLHNVLLTPDGIHRSQHQVAGAIQRKQNQAAMLALDLLRRYLQNECL